MLLDEKKRLNQASIEKLLSTQTTSYFQRIDLGGKGIRGGRHYSRFPLPVIWKFAEIFKEKL